MLLVTATVDELRTRILAGPLEEGASVQRVLGEFEDVAQIVPRPRVLTVVDCHRLVSRLHATSFLISNSFRQTQRDIDVQTVGIQPLESYS